MERGSRLEREPKSPTEASVGFLHDIKVALREALSYAVVLGIAAFGIYEVQLGKPLTVVAASVITGAGLAFAVVKVAETLWKRRR